MKLPFLPRTFALLLATAVILCGPARGAPGDVDLSFDPGLGVNGPVNAVAVQPDGKVIIGGRFTTVRGAALTNLARLNADGSSDATFVPGKSFDVVDSLALQPDGKLIVGSQLFQSYCDEFDCYSFYISILTRLESRGALDGSFFTHAVDTGSPYGFSVLTLQPDGKILAGGYFTAVDGISRNGVARFNANGTLDTSFNPGTGIGGHQPWVFAIAVQSNGLIVVGGMFDTFNGTNRNGLVRLNSDGSVDAGFNPGTQLTGDFSRTESVAIQPDGRILVGGYFTTGDSSCVARFNTNGTLDSTFNPGTGASGIVSELAVQPDGKVLLGGYFSAIDGTNRNRIARLNTDGSLDSSFDPGTGINWENRALVLQADGKVIVGGGFTTVDGTNRNRVARLNADGGLDTSFDPGSGIERAVGALALQADGKVLMGGSLVIGDVWWGPAGDAAVLVNGTNSFGRARLNVDGRMDQSFVTGGFYPNLYPLLIPTDCPDGGPYGCAMGAAATALLALPDGRVLVSGYIVSTITGDETFYQIYRGFLARFAASGALETDLNHSASFISTMALQPDGKIMVGGSLFLNGTNCNVARLHADGSVDASFQPAQGSQNITCLALQPDGRVIAGGLGGLKRFSSGGVEEACFSPAVTPGRLVSSVVLQPDGRLLIGGTFVTVNGVSRSGIARLNVDGSLDGEFDPGTGVNGTVSSIVLQPDGNVIIGGDFLSVNGVLRQYVARLYGGSPASRLRFYPTTTNVLVVAWPSSATGAVLQECNDLATAAWVNVTASPVTVGSEKHYLAGTSAGQRFFRVLGGAATGLAYPAPPPAAPQLSASTGDGRVHLSWTALNGATGHHIRRATRYDGPYVTIAQPGTNRFTDTNVVTGSPYFYTASVIYSCGESVASRPVGIYPWAPPVEVHVQNISMGWVASGSRYKARAFIYVVDNHGAPVSGATVVGDFGGAIDNAGVTGVSNGSGEATITASSSIRTGTVTFTVSDINTATMSYNPAANVMTSGTITR